MWTQSDVKSQKIEYLCKSTGLKVCRVWCAARSIHDVTIATYSWPDDLPKMKNALFVALEFSRACAVHSRSHTLNEQQEQITVLEGGKLWFYPLIGEGTLWCHGNVTVDISWNFVMSKTAVQSFSSIQKKSCEILYFLRFFITMSALWRHKSSIIICINQNLNNSATKNAIIIK